MMVRERMHMVVNNDDPNFSPGIWYNRAMVVFIIASIIPLWFKGQRIELEIIEYACVAVFITDYIMRWVTADLSLRRGRVSFVIYPFTPMAIIDALSILPAFLAINQSFKTLRVLRLLRALRAFKLIRYSKAMQSLISAIRNKRQQLIVVLALAVVYVTVCATVIFNVEPDTFPTIYDAFYWAVVSLTTVGYGDLYPVSAIGRFIAMISSFMGIAIVALPASIITAGLMEDLKTD